MYDVGIKRVVLTGSNLSQVLITETMDFKGKQPGRTYDVPHVAKYTSSNLFPSPATFAGTEPTTAQYGYISNLGDGAVLSPSTSVNGYFAETLLSFDLLTDLKIKGRIPLSWTVDQLKAALKSLRVEWVGYGTGADAGAPKNGVTLKIWIGPNNNWGTIGSNTASSPASVAYLVTDPAQIAARIDANGFFHILAHSTYPSDGTNPSTIYTDYVKVDVTLSVEALLVADPLTYDPASRATRTIAVNRNKTVVDTVVNAASVAAGNAVIADLGITDESEVWLMVNVDKQPWTLQANYLSALGGYDHNALFPVRKDVATAYSQPYSPAVSLLMSQIVTSATGLTPPTTIVEAKQFIAYPSPGRVRLYNSSDETATVTIRVVRVWR